MATSKDAIIYLELGATLDDWYEPTDSGDNQIFSFESDLVSRVNGDPVIRPNGIKNGRNLLEVADSGSDDVIDHKAFSAYFAGSEVDVSAGTDISITRGTTATPYKINSIVCDSSGTVSALAGADGTQFAATRGTAGGPPSIPLAKIELGQVRTTSATSAAISADEIYQVVGQHTERYDYPGWEINTIGDGNLADSSAEENAYFKFNSALPLIHGATAEAAAVATKKIYVQSYEPTFSELGRTVDWKQAGKTGSLTSTQIHRKTLGAGSSSHGNATFTAYLDDGITDLMLSVEGKNVMLKCRQAATADPYQITQGEIYFDISRPVDNHVNAAVSILAEIPTVNFDG